MSVPEAPQLGSGAVPRADRIVYSFAKHWLAIFNLVVFLYVGLPFMAPVFMHLGLTTPAEIIYKVYYPLCHQYAFRSWWLFGEKVAYTRQEIDQVLGVNTLTTTGQFVAKDFLGNAQVGYKVAFCQRDVAIYGGLLLGALIFGAVRGRGVRPVHWLLWLLIGVVPVGLDGLSQLFSEIPGFAGWLNPMYNAANIYWRESTPLLRTLTGGLFGFMLVWLTYPYIEDSMLDTRMQLQRRFGWRQ